jgi:tetratricopeptide (TPR) repeat protein
MPSALPPDWNGSSEILCRVQEDRIVVQDYCPFPESIEWRLGQQYLQQRGNKAFISDTVPVPFAINNDGNLSDRAARLLFASISESERTKTIDDEILVLELGIGVGLFSRLFLDSFAELCAREGKDYYSRLRYLAADYSEQMLLDACKHGIFSNHAGRYELGVVDALNPSEGLKWDQRSRAEPNTFHAVFLNYLLDCLPATVLKIDGDAPMQLCVRTSLARGVDLSAYTDLGPEEIRALVASSNLAEIRELREAFHVFSSDYEYRVTDLENVPYVAFALRHGHAANLSYVCHSYGAMQSLDKLLPLVRDDGFILINDYGHNDVGEAQHFEHQRFSDSTCVGLNFPLLQDYYRTANKVFWEQPREDAGSVYARLLGHRISDRTVACFHELFSKENIEKCQQAGNLARECIRIGRLEAATTAYRQAVAEQPRNWLLLSEVSKFVTFSLGNPEAGVALAEAAVALNPACSAELWNTQGDAYFAHGRIDDAHAAFQMALAINPEDPRAYFNLCFVYVHNKEYSRALEAIAQAFNRDRTGEYREWLLQKQAEVLKQLAQRYRTDCQLLANRISQCPTPGTRDRLNGDARPTNHLVANDGRQCNTISNPNVRTVFIRE